MQGQRWILTQDKHMLNVEHITAIYQKQLSGGRITREAITNTWVNGQTLTLDLWSDVYKEDDTRMFTEFVQDLRNNHLNFIDVSSYMRNKKV